MISSIWWWEWKINFLYIKYSFSISLQCLYAYKIIYKTRRIICYYFLNRGKSIKYNPFSGNIVVSITRIKHRLQPTAIIILCSNYQKNKNFIFKLTPYCHIILLYFYSIRTNDFKIKEINTLTVTAMGQYYNYIMIYLPCIIIVLYVWVFVLNSYNLYLMCIIILLNFEPQ